MELCTQSLSKELFKKINVAVLFSCCCPTGKGEQYYIHQGGVIPRRVKFTLAKQEHIKWMRTITALMHCHRLSSPVEFKPQII